MRVGYRGSGGGGGGGGVITNNVMVKQWWLPGSDEFLAGGFRVWLNAALQSVHMNSLASFAISDAICCWALDRMYCMTHPPSHRGSSLPAVGTDSGATLSRQLGRIWTV